MSKEKGEVFGVVGTVTQDFISFSSGRFFSGLGGILYQAAALCGLGKKVRLFSNLGEELLPVFDKIVASFKGCLTDGICVVPGPGNRVHLRYPKKGERVEILESHVPPLNPKYLIDQAPRLDFLISVVNSGRDFTFASWRKIVASVKAPIWLDIHSLPLSFVLHQPRSYRALTEWKDWIKGITYLQANEREVASMLGQPGVLPSLGKIRCLGEEALECGLRAVFITLGKKGVLVMAEKSSRVLPAPAVGSVVDTTGCGDVFCAGTAVELATGSDPIKAASVGVRLAAKAARVAGVMRTYRLIRRLDSKGELSP